MQAASFLRARRRSTPRSEPSALDLTLGAVAHRFLTAIVENRSREICVYGPRGEAKTQTLLLAAVSHAVRNAELGFPTPVKWIGVADTHRAHVVKTIPSLFDPLWNGAWRVFDGDHLAVFFSGGGPLLGPVPVGVVVTG